jgi:hypothetical protein
VPVDVRGRSSPFLDHDGGLRGQSPVVVSGGSWLWAVVAMCRSCDESGHSPSVDHSAGTAWPSVTGGGGPCGCLSTMVAGPHGQSPNVVVGHRLRLSVVVLGARGHSWAVVNGRGGRLLRFVGM